MSFSNPTIENPVSKFITFKGDKGILQYYKKSETEGEKGENVEIKMPCLFVVLDELSTIKGFNDETESGIYSNEVHSLGKEELNVRTFKGGKSIKGKYSDIKGDIKQLGGKFTKSVYALLVTKESTEIVNFQLSGAAFSAWMDCKINKQKFVIGIVGTTDEKKGAIKYKKPVFKAFNMDKRVYDAAIAADNTLQKYLEQYKNKAVEEVEAVEVAQEEKTPDLPNDTGLEDLPF